MSSGNGYTVQNCLEFHTDEDAESQKDRFSSIVDVILDDPNFARCKVLIQDLYALVTNKKIYIYDAFHIPRKGSSNDYLSLVLSVACYTDRELYAVPIKICINPYDATYNQCPDVFLFYDQSLIVNQDCPFLNLDSNKVCTPYMRDWVNNKKAGLCGLINDLSSVFSHTPPVLHAMKDCTYMIPSEKYKKLKFIGGGACGVVYKGIYNDHEVAIKECLCGMLPKKQILLELEVMTKLCHENVIRNYGYNIHKDEDGREVISFIMEKAEGSLEDLLGPLTPVGQKKKANMCKINYMTKKLYIYQIATGLLYTYREGVVHGDLKIDNILIVNGNCKIADFGMSKVIEEDVDITVSRVGDIGNKQHRAPELYKIDYRVKMDSDELKKTLMKADVYAFGVLVGEILTGYLETTTYKGNQSKNTVGTTWEIDMEEGYRYRPNALLKQDPEIYEVVADCMKECDRRPNMEEIYLRIGKWFDHDTCEIVG
ncbi:hypothetical protein WA171_000178 [Blastocystis sp. BT1]